MVAGARGHKMPLMAFYAESGDVLLMNKQASKRSLFMLQNE